MKLFINKEIPVSVDPQPLRPPAIDNQFRFVPLGQPGLRDLDNPLYASYVANGDNSEQIQSQIIDEISDSLNEQYESMQKNVLSKLLCYPESLLSINAKSFTEGHEVPRHILKITILDYAGGSLISEEGKKMGGNFVDNLMGSGKGFAGEGFWQKTKSAFSDAKNIVGELKYDESSFYKNETNVYQDRANELSSGTYSLNNLVNESVKEGAAQQQSDKFREHVKRYLESDQGLDFATKYLTSDKNFAAKSFAVDQIASKTQVKMRMLPDEVKNVIYLYATGDNLVYNYATNWSHGKAMAGNLADVQNIIGNMMDNPEYQVADAVKGIFTSVASKVMRDGLSNENSPEEMRSLYAKLGVAPAQNYEYLFDSVGRRSFSTSHTFYPKSQKEIRDIAKIITALKHYSHPSRPNRDALVRVPCVFLLENLTYVDGKGWVENIYLPKYKICALQNITVNYSQNGNLITHQVFQDATKGPTFKAPVSIQMTMNFQEMHILTREDIPAPDKFFNADVQKDGYY
jgi:hypothetical protein